MRVDIDCWSLQEDSSWSHCMENSELPSDLSLQQERVEAGDSGVLPNLYKFKSNIRQRLVTSLTSRQSGLTLFLITDSTAAGVE